MQIAITFDTEHPDRPHVGTGGVHTLLDHLEVADVRATFFMQGRWVEAFPDDARRVRTAGHLIGSHSHYHSRMTLLSDRGLEADIAAAEKAIKDIVGIDPKPLFRCPFGDGAEDERVLRALERAGYRDIRSDVDPEDWNHERTTADIERSVLEGIRTYGQGCVVQLHSWPRTTAEALPRVLRTLAAEGIEPVRLDELQRPGVIEQD